MNPASYTNLKDLLADILEKHTPGGVMIEVVSEEAGEGGGGIGNDKPADYEAEMSEVEDKAEDKPDDQTDEQPAGEPMSTDKQPSSEDPAAAIGDVVEELRAVSQTHAEQAERLEGVAAALKSMGG
jgi:hypothetical protein